MSTKETENKVETKATVVEAMPEQNGIRQPRPNTNCSAIWDKAAEMSNKRGAPVAVADLLETLTVAGFNPATVKTQYARWRKFHSISGVVASDKARVKKEEAEAKKAEREALKQAKKDEAEAKKKAKAEAAEAAKAEKARLAAEKKEAAAEAKAEKEAAKAAKAAQEAAKKEAFAE